MDVVFRNARLIDPETGERRGDLGVKDGRIVDAADVSSGHVIEADGCCLAPGIVDIGVKVSEPGERHKESFRSAGRAAAAGGVTTMVTRPDTTPAIDTPEGLEFVRRRANEAAPVNVLPMAALTRGRQGREMAEIGFLKDAGAVAFSDADAVIANPKVFSRALIYATELGALVVGHPQDPDLSEGAVATSGKFASLKGLSAVSPVAERIGLDRDLALVEATGARYHADQVTTRAGIERVVKAKADGVDVTAGISIHHLTLNEFDVGPYRTFFKVKPPLRSEDDRIAAVQAVADGVIDIISSMHTPQDEESKRRPYEEASSGAVGLETLLPAALRLVHEGMLDMAALFRALSLNPARRLGLTCGSLSIGSPADLILFDPDRPFVLDRATLRSKSKNTPFDGARMQGRVLGTWVGGQRVFDHESGD